MSDNVVKQPALEEASSADVGNVRTSSETDLGQFIKENYPDGISGDMLGGHDETITAAIIPVEELGFFEK